MPRVLIIGYGNSLGGDDAFGPLLAEKLRETVPGPEIEIISLYQLLPELMEPVSRAGQVYFLDAAADGRPGEIKVTPIEPRESAGSSAHTSTPAALLAGARKLYGQAGQGTMVCVTAAQFEFGAPLSEPVQRAMDTLLRRWIETGAF